MKSCYFGRKRWYDADEVDKILAELRENIHRICDTCMMPIEVKNPWNEKEMK